MREEGFVAGADDVRLTVEIMVPSSQVGRIIGKGGQNVRELQRVTGSVIKLPEQGASPQEDETTVHIIGPFFSVQVSTKHFGRNYHIQQKIVSFRSQCFSISRMDLLRLFFKKKFPNS